jgi:hypothetical protein
MHIPMKRRSRAIGVRHRAKARRLSVCQPAPKGAIWTQKRVLDKVEGSRDSIGAEMLQGLRDIKAGWPRPAPAPLDLSALKYGLEVARPASRPET